MIHHRPGFGILGRSASTSLAKRETLSPRRDGTMGPGPRRAIVQLEGVDAEAETMTVVLTPVVEPLDSVEHGPCVAIVEWGNGSGTAIAEVDFGKGTAIQVAGSYLLVDGRNDGAVADGGRVDIDGGSTTIDPDPGDQRVAVIVSGYGPRPPSRATRTFYGRDLAPDESRLFPVPNFATGVSLSRAPIVGTTIALEVGDSVADPARLFRDGPHVFDEVPGGIVQLYPAAGAVAVRNVGRAPVSTFQLVFELAL